MATNYLVASFTICCVNILPICPAPLTATDAPAFSIPLKVCATPNCAGVDNTAFNKVK